jgi:hypothetical protein
MKEITLIRAEKAGEDGELRRSSDAGESVKACCI